jgi:hypothetical protein
MRFGDEGEPVRRLQLALIAAGYPMPIYGADGDFGPETARALGDFAVDHGLVWARSRDVDPAVLDALAIRPACSTVAPCAVGPVPGVKVYDLRAEARDPRPKSRVRHGKTTRRDPSAIDAIVLHQAGIKFGGTGETLVRRSLNVACHAMAFDGALALAAPLEWYIHHGDRFNATTLGLEVDGLYPGILGGKTAGGGPETPLTEGTVAAAREGVRRLVVDGRAMGMPIQYIYAHRQADSWRRADPGQGLWQRIVLEYAVPMLGLETRPGKVLPHKDGPRRDGLPVPMAWDPDGVGRY